MNILLCQLAGEECGKCQILLSLHGGMIILYHVLPDYASLYEENTTSSKNLTNPSTSITNGYGIFTGLNSDTLYIDAEEQE